MKRSILVVIILLFWLTCGGQRAWSEDTFSSFEDFQEKCFHVEVSEIFFDAHTGLLKSIKYAKVPPDPNFDPRHPEKTALKFIERYFDPYAKAAISKTLRLKDIVQEDKTYIVKFEQICCGFPVYLSEVAVYMDDQGRVQSIQANVTPSDSLSGSAEVNVDNQLAINKAIQWLAQKYNVSPAQWRVLEPPQLVIYNPALLRVGPNENVLAWLIGLSSQEEITPRTVIVSAHTGEVLWEGSSLFEGFQYVDHVCLEVNHPSGREFFAKLELFMSPWNPQYFLMYGYFTEDQEKHLPVKGAVSLEGDKILASLEGPLYSIFPVLSYNFAFNLSDLSATYYCHLKSQLVYFDPENKPFQFSWEGENNCQIRLVPCEDMGTNE